MILLILSSISLIFLNHDKRWQFAVSALVLCKGLNRRKKERQHERVVLSKLSVIPQWTVPEHNNNCCANCSFTWQNQSVKIHPGYDLQARSNTLLHSTCSLEPAKMGLPTQHLLRALLVCMMIDCSCWTSSFNSCSKEIQWKWWNCQHKESRKYLF